MLMAGKVSLPMELLSILLSSPTYRTAMQLEASSIVKYGVCNSGEIQFHDLLSVTKKITKIEDYIYIK